MQETAQFPSSAKNRSRLKELQHQLVIKRCESLLMAARAGTVDGLLVVVQSDQNPTYLWLDGSYRINPALAHAALLHGVTELFNQISVNAANQLKLDLK